MLGVYYAAAAVVRVWSFHPSGAATPIDNWCLHAGRVFTSGWLPPGASGVHPQGHPSWPENGPGNGHLEDGSF